MMNPIPLKEWIKKDLVSMSLIHPSSDLHNNNKSLEFVGDAILESFVRTQLVKMFPFASIQELNSAKCKIVSNENLINVAKRLGVNELLKASSIVKKKPFADAIEAMIAELDQKKKRKEKDLLLNYIMFVGLGLAHSKE